MKAVEMHVYVIRSRPYTHPTNPNLDGWEKYPVWVHERLVKPGDRIQEGSEAPQATIFWCDDLVDR